MESNNPNLFRQMAEQSKDIYFEYLVAANTMQYLSPAYETMLGMPLELIKNPPDQFINIIHPEDRTYAKNQFLTCLNQVLPDKFEFRIICHNQEVKDVRVSVYPVKENGHFTLIAGIMEDITLVKSNILYAEKLNTRKDTMLDILAHDLRGPISIISMIASNIEREPQVAGNKNVLQSVSYIRQLCQRNIALIRDLMNQEFLESAEVDLRKERADLVWEINDVISYYKTSAEVLSRTFKVNSNRQKLFIQIDSLKLMQVLNNLISNAIKFTADNGIIEVDIEDRDAAVQIIVRDNGIGIPEELQPFLYDKFTRARRQGLNGEDAVGLGMSIIKTIVELHGGSINLESKENAGCAFYITIPKQ